jgi:hypothetical protein
VLELSSLLAQMPHHGYVDHIWRAKVIILGNGWLDPSTILGVGIYHAPRFLSEAEKQRELDDMRAGEFKNVDRKKKMKAGEVRSKNFFSTPQALFPGSLP